MRNPFRKSESRSLPAPENQVSLTAYVPSTTSPTTAMQVNDVWSCVRLLSMTAASLPLVPYRRVEGGRERVTGGKLPSLLERPAPACTQAAFVAKVMVDLLLQGNSFIGLYRDGPDVVQLGTLPPDRVQIEIKAGQPFYRYSPQVGGQMILTVDDLIHVRALVSIDGVVGLSPLRQAAGAINLSDSLAKHAASYMANDGRPSGILRVDPGPDQEKFQEWLSSWNAQHVGVENAGKIAVMGGSADFTAIQLPPDSMQLLEQRRLSTVEICRAFGCPPHLINADTNESMTYSSTEMQATELLKFGLQPWLTQIEQSISNHPALCSERQYVQFNADALMRSDSKTRAEIFEIALGRSGNPGWLSREEIRELEDRPPEPATTATTPTGTPATNGQGNTDNVTSPMEVDTNGN